MIITILLILFWLVLGIIFIFVVAYLINQRDIYSVSVAIAIAIAIAIGLFSLFMVGLFLNELIIRYNDKLEHRKDIKKECIEKGGVLSHYKTSGPSHTRKTYRVCINKNSIIELNGK